MKQIILACLLFSSPVAAKPACDQLAGSVIFHDMIYGTLSGVVLSGMYLLATDHHDQPGKIVAGSAFGTTVIGAGVGVMELALRDCPSTQMNLQGRQKTWQPMVIANQKTVGGGFRFHW